MGLTDYIHNLRFMISYIQNYLLQYIISVKVKLFKSYLVCKRTLFFYLENSIVIKIHILLFQDF